MNRTKLYRQWLQEEDAARMKGWDFSHLRGRYEEEQDLPWDYEQVVRAFLRPDKELLDMDTGGGEFLLSLGHPCDKTSATEGWPPNADLCRLLHPGGVFIAEQVGAQNDRELVKLLLGELPLPFPRQTLACAIGEAQGAGLRVLRGRKPSAPSAFGMWGRLFGSPVCCPGNSRAFRWTPAGGVSIAHRRHWNTAA